MSSGGPGRGASVRLRGLSKYFGEGSPPAVDSIDLNLEPGEFLTLLGPSGSGKTTTLNMIAGFVEPSSGVIELHGADISRIPAHKRDFGMVFQSYALFPHLSVEQNIAFPLKQRRVPKRERVQRVGEIMELVGLTGLGSRMSSALSGGQQQRVALARAVVFSPTLLLLDEPLGALDRALRQTLQNEIKRIHRELGLTFVFVTHDQDEAMSLSDRIAVFNKGRIERIGVPVDLYDDPGTLFVAQFVGESNQFAGHFLSEEYEWRGRLFRLTEDRPSARDDVLVVRPERLHLAESGSVGPSGCNWVRATVLESSYLGTVRRVDLDFGGGVTGVSILGSTGSVAWRPGDEVVAYWRASDQVFVSGVEPRVSTRGVEKSRSATSAAR